MKHNVVYTDLPNEYVDIDFLMERALVALLNRYVEVEHGGFTRYASYVDELIQESTEEGDQYYNQYVIESQLMWLYSWFKHNKEEKDEDLITEKLVELVKLRSNLWT